MVEVQVELLDAQGQPVLWEPTTEKLDDESLRLQVGSGENLRSVPLQPHDNQPGHFHAEIESLPPGVYQVRPIGAIVDDLLATAESTDEDELQATFTVNAEIPTELVDTRCNRVLASQIAELAGGQVVPPTAVKEILTLTNLEPVVSHRVQRQPLWLRWKYLWLVFGCLQTEWIIRKWKGLS